ncbi:hypothetical protein EIN_221960 [Entamoeba invadens IP1]|uniref:Uncharacterized protein n=1 Tax=Entamoeba invadens IP1 TaxID=370355 RepID=A0A0A1U7X8_ENTIV|nr:hypothetical protein EIN_221960 [Entamoeba invadens IP1]ELP88063.1 hypothetical protein EIN_221960 [Entamoeba invadens IP1]|eukprot:XP_004254834.1 hypothetical protein EIN_221960 [Entamoeba invadens IP1]
METLLLCVFTLIASADYIKLYDDGDFYEGFEVVNPDNLTVGIQDKDRSHWEVVTMLPGEEIVFTTNDSVSTTIQDKDKTYKTLRFHVKYDNDDLKNIPLNVKIFSTSYDSLNETTINNTAGYTIKVKKNKNMKAYIKLDQFNLDGEVSTIIFTRTGDSTTSVDLMFDELELDTKDTETDSYENSASSLLAGAFLFAIVLVL